MTLEENVFFAKRNLVDSIWKSANLEGIAVTFPETQMIVDGLSIANKTLDEITAIVNLKKAWEYLFATINEPINLSLIQDFNRIVGRDIVNRAGFLRNADVRISGTNYKPKLPIDYEVKENVNDILRGKNKQEVALDLMLYLMRSQLFFDGNKRTSMLIANKIFIENGLGILSVAKENIHEFLTMLVEFYESNDGMKIKSFCKKHCVETMLVKEVKNNKETKKRDKGLER